MTQPNNNTLTTRVQRNPLDFSLNPRDEARRDAILRQAWLKIVEGFACRPSPRSAWDHAADGSEARWKKILEPMRSAIASAVFIGNERLIGETLEGCRDFLRAIEADLSSLIPPKEESSIESLALDESESAGETQTEEI